MPVSVEWAGVERVALDWILWAETQNLLLCAYVAIIFRHHPYSGNSESHGKYCVILLVLTALAREEPGGEGHSKELH